MNGSYYYNYLHWHLYLHWWRYCSWYYFTVLNWNTRSLVATVRQNQHCWQYTPHMINWAEWNRCWLLFKLSNLSIDSETIEKTRNSHGFSTKTTHTVISAIDTDTTRLDIHRVFMVRNTLFFLKSMTLTLKIMTIDDMITNLHWSCNSYRYHYYYYYCPNVTIMKHYGYWLIRKHHKVETVANGMETEAKKTENHRAMELTTIFKMTNQEGQTWVDSSPIN